MTDPLFAINTPVFTVGGESNGDLGRDCVHLEIEEGTEGLRTLRAHFVAVGAGATGPPAPMLYLDGQIVDFGKQIEVSLGPDGGQRKVFDGAISALELVFGDSEPPRLVVSAEDALMRLRMSRRMRTYTRITDGEIAEQLARDHGLQAEVTADGPRYDVVQQMNQSDLAFLRERARLVQAELWCTGRTVHFSTRSKRRATTLSLVQGNDLLTARVSADLAHQRSEVVVTGYDAATRGVIDERAGSEAISAEVTGGRTGPDIAKRSLGAGASLRVREVALTGDEASAWATAEMLRRARGFVSFAGVTRGSPDMEVGSRVRIESIGAPFEGDGYYVTRIRHTFDHEQGLRTRFEAERATLNEVA